MSALLDPRSWSPGWTLLGACGLVVGAVVVAVIQAVRCAPIECDRCGGLIPADDWEAHQAEHARLGDAYEVAAVEGRGAGDGGGAPAVETPEAPDGRADVEADGTPAPESSIPEGERFEALAAEVFGAAVELEPVPEADGFADALRRDRSAEMRRVVDRAIGPEAEDGGR